ncbi:MAG: cupin-like domain-containing protein [Xanthomonas sp.]
MEFYRNAWNALGDVGMWAFHEMRFYRNKGPYLQEDARAAEASARLAAADYRKVERVRDIDVRTFCSRYLATSTPIIVADGCRDWRAKDAWTFDYFGAEFGDMQVQLQGQGFEKRDRVVLSSYLSSIAHQPPIQLGEQGASVDYLRYTYGPRLEHLLFTWGFGSRVKTEHFTCAAYQRIANDWALPYFLPDSDYRVPWVQAGKLQPNKRMCLDWGLYFSAPGARTRLHVDGTRTNAIICQIRGRKSGWLFSPDLEYAARQLAESGGAGAAGPADAAACAQGGGTIWRFDLEPGEIMLIPKGLAHEVITLAPSISMIYNFVTNAEYTDYYRQMRERGPGWVARAPIIDDPRFQAIVHAHAVAAT